MPNLTIYACLCSLLITVIMQTFFANAAPSITTEWQLDAEKYGWLFSSYMIATAVAIPVSGQLVDRHGARKVLMTGISTFTLATGLAQIASTFEALVLGRILQGLSAALIGTAALVFIGDLIPSRLHSRYFGVAGAVQASGYLVGPAAGGILIQLFGWRPALGSIFLLTCLTLLALLPSQTTSGPRVASSLPINWRSSILFCVCLISLLALLDNSVSPLALTLTAMLLATGTILLTLSERAHSNPLIAKHLIQSHEYRFSIIACLFIGMFQYGAVAYIPLVAQNVRHHSIASTAWFTLPMVVGGMMGNVIGGRLNEYINAFFINSIGVLTCTIGFLLFAQLLTSGTDLHLQIGSLLIGLGISFYYPTQLTIANKISQGNTGVAIAMLNTARNIGGAVAISMLTFTMTATLELPLAEQLSKAFLVLSGASLVCLFLNAILNKTR